MTRERLEPQLQRPEHRYRLDGALSVAGQGSAKYTWRPDEHCLNERPRRLVNILGANRAYALMRALALTLDRATSSPVVPLIQRAVQQNRWGASMARHDLPRRCRNVTLCGLAKLRLHAPRTVRQ